ncbi:hypothetical protein ACFL4O_03760, partial [bacterium]
KFGNKNSLKSLFAVKQCITDFRMINNKIKQKGGDYKPEYIPVKLYTVNQVQKKEEKITVNHIKEMLSSGSKDAIIKELMAGVGQDNQEIEALLSNLNKHNSNKELEKILSKINNLKDQQDKENAERRVTYEGKHGNILWRMFVVSDMTKEIIRNKNLFGEHFGKPFRSKSLEMSDWTTATGYWVGWLEPHNSYLHIIYRAGIVGIIFISCILFLFLKMTIGFIKVKSLRGILLSSLLLYWLAIANFEVILELPYFAIPFWITFGAAYKYFIDLKRETIDG